MTHCAAWLLSKVACLYSSLISSSTSPLMCTQFYLQMTMSCGSWQNCHIAHTWHSILYLITVLTVQKASNSFPTQLQVWKSLSENLDKFCPLQSACLALCTLLTVLHTSPCATQFTLHSPFAFDCVVFSFHLLHTYHCCHLLNLGSSHIILHFATFFW